MGVETRSAAEGAAAPDAAERRRRLAAQLRELASEASQLAGGAVLVFASPGGAAAPTLRAAAGFDSPEAARAAAAAVARPMQRAVERGEPARSPCPPALAGRADGGLLIHPFQVGDAWRGALVVGTAAPAPDALPAQVGRLAERAGLYLDRAELRDRLELATRPEAAPEPETRSEEILKLSEALFAQDIELLRKEEKLGKIEKLKNDFIEKMSRELRTPLNSIIETIISVLAGENEALSEEGKAMLRSALDDGTAFERTLQNILDLWKIKQGELRVEIQEVNFGELVDEAIFSIQDGLEGKPLVVEPRLEPPFPKIRTDLTKLNQILFLLLENAVRFTPRGRIEILARVEADVLHCEVRDTGIGICPDDQNFIFDEFFQVDAGPSSRYGGAGLGLTLVRDLLLLLDGEVSVTSDVGHGTSVRFQIPVLV